MTDHSQFVNKLSPFKAKGQSAHRYGIWSQREGQGVLPCWHAEGVEYRQTDIFTE